MTYRDDHDAAIARADALEEDVERVEHERDELAAKVKQLEEAARKPKPAPAEPTPAPSPPSPRAVSREEERRKERRFGWIVTGVLLAVFAVAAGWGLMRDRSYDADLAAWEAQGATYRAYQDHWGALISVEPCVRKVTTDNANVRALEHTDPRTDHTGWQLTASCLDGARALIKDPQTAPQVRRALEAWTAAQSAISKPAKALWTYYLHREWVDDGGKGASALWAPVLQLIDKEDAALAQVRRDALPAIDAEIAMLQSAHEKASGRDKVWWGIELARKLRAIDETALLAGGVTAGKPLDVAAAAAAVRDQVVALRALDKQAPSGRRLIEYAPILESLASGQVPSDDGPFDRLSQADQNLMTASMVPASPPAPGKRPSRRR